MVFYALNWHEPNEDKYQSLILPLLPSKVSSNLVLWGQVNKIHRYFEVILDNCSASKNWCKVDIHWWISSVIIYLPSAVMHCAVCKKSFPYYNISPDWNGTVFDQTLCLNYLEIDMIHISTVELQIPGLRKPFDFPSFGVWSLAVDPLSVLLRNC